MKRVRKFLVAILVFSMVTTCFAAVDWTSQAEEKCEVKNIIFMIGDGMGDGALNAGRMVRETLYLDGINKLGYLNTNNVNNELTDSAAGGTALATGFKTKNTRVGVDKDGAVLENLTEWMIQKGKKTGIVSSAYVVDATPGAFGAHTTNRSNYADIAKGMVDLGVDVILGGGSSQFNSTINNGGSTISGIDYAKNVGGYQYVTRKADLNAINSGKVLGLFSANNLNFPSSKTPEEPNLEELTKKTLSLLENEDGFFAMIEGGRIDHAAHQNQATNLKEAMIEFDDAIKVAMDYADTHEGTLVVITADHETGGVGVSAGVQGHLITFSTTGHTNAKVPYFVYGAGMEHFEGLTDNTEIAPAIKKAVTEGSTLGQGGSGSGSDNSGSGSDNSGSGSNNSGSGSNNSGSGSQDSDDNYVSGGNASNNGLKSPNTGDNSSLIVWVALLAVCSGLIVISTVYRRKKHN